MAGEPDVIEKLKQGGYKANGKTFKNHIDGFNLLHYLTRKEKKSPRNICFYFGDDGDVLGVRWDNWKIVFMEQRFKGTTTSNTYWDGSFIQAGQQRQRIWSDRRD